MTSGMAITTIIIFITMIIIIIVYCSYFWKELILKCVL